MKPVYVINGFLESGKTEFISFTLAQPYFQIRGTTLLILCEEGENEYDEALLKKSRTVVELIEEETGQRPTKLGVLSSEYHMFRSSLFADAFGVEFVGIPAHTSRVSQMINHFMREVAGVWHYILLGGSYD